MVNKPFHVKHARNSLADAEAAEDLAQHVLDVDPAGDAAERAARRGAGPRRAVRARLTPAAFRNVGKCVQAPLKLAAGGARA